MPSAWLQAINPIMILVLLQDNSSAHIAPLPSQRHRSRPWCTQSEPVSWSKMFLAPRACISVLLLRLTL